MAREDRFVDVRDAIEKGFDPGGHLARGGIAYGVGNIDCCGTCIDSGFDHTAQKIDFRPGGVFG